MKKVLMILSLVLLVCYGPVLVFNKGILIFWGDGHEQVFYFILNSIQNFQSLFKNIWDMNLGLGGSILSHIFNGMFSPFNFFAVFISFLPKGMIPLLLDVTRYIIVAVFAYAWISEFIQNDRARVTGAIMTVFSGWVMTNLHLSFFQDAYVLMIITLFFSERLLKGKNGMLFAFSLSMLIIINPYFAYMFSFYLVIYLTFRFTVIKEKFKFKAYFLEIMKFIKFYIIGLLLSMFILLPFAQLILNNPRLGSTLDRNLFLPYFNKYNLYLMFTSLLSPVLNDFDSNQFISRFNPNLGDSLLFQSFIFSFHVFIVMLMNSIWMSFRDKFKLLFFIFFVYLIALFPLTYFVLNGNFDFRWSFFLVFSNIIFTVNILEHDHELEKKYRILNTLLLVSLLAVLAYYSLSKGLLNPAYVETIKLNIVISVGFIISYGLLHYKNKYYEFLWMGLIFFEAIFVLNNRMLFNGVPRYIDNLDFEALYSEDVHVFNSLKVMDEGFYRIDTSSLPVNYPLAYNYNGFTFYSSLYNSELRSLMNNRFSENWKQGYLPSKFIMKNLLGAKYYVSNIEDDVPFGFEKIGVMDGWLIYQNSSAIELGFATPNITSMKTIEKYSKAMQDYIFYQTIVLDEQENLNQFKLPKKIGNDLINGKVEGDFNDGYLLFDYSDSIPHTSCKFDFYNSGNIVRSLDVYEYGYFMFELEEPIDKVYSYCTNNYNGSEYTPIDVYHVERQFLLNLYASTSSHDLFTETTFENDTISSRIRISKDQSYVFTSIPYDKDWVVRANGIKVEKFRVNDGFIGFVLDTGAYDIEMVYRPRAFYIGLCISMITLVSIILFAFKKRLTRRLFAQ